MAKNELIVGEPRLGWLVDGNPDTERIAVMLQDTGIAIELTIPLQGLFAGDDPYGRWWSDGVVFGDDPDRSIHSYRPPHVLLIQDNRGPVVLVGCRSTNFITSSHAGEGRIVSNYAVLGGRTLKYAKIHGLRTEIPALAAWTRLSTMNVDITPGTDNRVKSVQMTLREAAPVPLARRMNLMMRPSWRIEQSKSEGRFVAYEGVKLDTTLRKALTWDEHFHVHDAVLNLVSIAAWQPFGYSFVEVHRSDEAPRNPTAAVMSPHWSPVATHRVPEHKPWSKPPQFLFPYDEIGYNGIARWLRLRKKYRQAIDPLLTILRSENRWSHSNVVQSGIALENLGYLIDTEKNNSANLNGRGQMSFKCALNVILADMAVTPLADTDAWIDRARDTYMGAKHPDRPEPDTLVMLNTLRENILVLRFWIALQLGTTATSLSNRLDTDPLARELAYDD